MKSLTNKWVVFLFVVSCFVLFVYSKQNIDNLPKSESVWEIVENLRSSNMLDLAEGQLAVSKTESYLVEVSRLPNVSEYDHDIARFWVRVRPAKELNKVKSWLDGDMNMGFVADILGEKMSKIRLVSVDRIGYKQI